MDDVLVLSIKILLIVGFIAVFSILGFIRGEE